MIVQKEFLTKLREFGINTYESKLWVALLSRGVSTAGELSDIANVPRSRSYDVLVALQRKGFINVKQGKPIKYTAVPPEEVLERRKEIVKMKSERQIKLINELRSNNLLAELITLHTKGNANISGNELTGTIRGDTNIQNHIESMIKSARKTISIYTTARDLADYYTSVCQLLEKACNMGVEIMIATQINKDSKEIIEVSSGFAKIRHTPKKARMLMVDGKDTLFMLFDTEKIHKKYDIGVWINSEYFAGSLESSFKKEFENLVKN